MTKKLWTHATATALLLAGVCVGGACDTAQDVIDQLQRHHPPPPPVATQQLAVYLGQPQLGTWKTVRHTDGTWDPISAPADLDNGNVLRASSAGTTGYVFTVDGRSGGRNGGALLVDSPANPRPGAFALITLPSTSPPLIVPQSFTVAEAAVTDDGVFHACGALPGNGGVLHSTRRSDGGFAAWDQVATPVSAASASCAAIGSVLHVCAADATGSILHSTRTGEGPWQSWQPLGPAGVDLGAVDHLLCRADGANLVALARNSQGAFLSQEAAGGEWSAWQHLAEVLQDPRADELSEIALVDGQLHAVGSSAIGQHLWHAVRHGDGTWGPIEDLAQVVSGYPAGARSVGAVSVALP